MKSIRTRIEALEESTGLAGGDCPAELLARYGRPASLTAEEAAAADAYMGRCAPGCHDDHLQRAWAELLQNDLQRAAWEDLAGQVGRPLVEMYRDWWAWHASLPREGVREAIDFVLLAPLVWEIVDPAIGHCPKDPWAYHKRPDLAQLTEEDKITWYAGLLAGGEYREEAVNFALEQWEMFKAWWLAGGGDENGLHADMQLWPWEAEDRDRHKRYIAEERERVRRFFPRLWDEQGNYIADLAKQAPPIGGGEVAHDDGNGDKATAQEL